MSEQMIINYWLDKAGQDLASAKANFLSGRFENAVRDAYFACFHVFSGLLLKDGKNFRKHKEVRSALHRDYVRTNRVDPRWGKHYDWLYENRQKADYRPMVRFDPEQIEQIIEESEGFIQEVKRLLDQ